MIRVLHIVKIMNRAGLETLLINLYRNIDRSKVQFDFLTSSTDQGDYDDEIRALGGKIYNVASRRQGLFKHRRQLVEFFKKHPEYKIVHVHVSSLSNVTSLKVAAKVRVPNRIIHSHNTSQKGRIHRILHRINQRNVTEYATKYFACSDAAAKWLYGDELYRKLDIHVINNAIDAQRFTFDEEVRENVRKQFNINEKFAIGHVGRFNEQKNHIFLIDIFKEIHNIKPNAVLMLVGRGELEEQVKNKVIGLGLSDNVMFMGVRSDIPDLLQAMDAFLLPSLHEGLPVTLVEAQASGLKCFISDAVTEEVDITGLVEFISLQQPPQVWAKRIIEGRVEHLRRNTYQDIVKAGYDIGTIAKNLEKFYLDKSHSIFKME